MLQELAKIPWAGWAALSLPLIMGGALVWYCVLVDLRESRFRRSYLDDSHRLTSWAIRGHRP